MKKFYSALLILSTAFTLNSNAQVINWSWAQGFAGSSSANSKVRVVSDNAGYAYTVGLFEGSTSFGSFNLTTTGFNDGYLAKWDATGNCIWAKRFGGAGYTAATAVATDNAGNIYVTGTFTSSMTVDAISLVSMGGADVFLIKFDNSGTALWAKKMGGFVADLSDGITTDNQNNVYVAGSFAFKIYFDNDSLSNGSASTSDVFIAKYSSSGTYIWGKKAGGTQTDQGTGITFCNNRLYVSGTFAGSATFGTLPPITSTGFSDGFVAKYDVDGNALWVKKGGGASNDNISAISSSKQYGDIYVVGSFSGASATFAPITITSNGAGYSDMFLVKYDSMGVVSWAKKGGGNSNDDGFGVAADTLGLVVVTGTFKGNGSWDGITAVSAGAADGFVTKYTRAGTPQYVLTIAGASDENAYSIAFWGQNQYYIVGNYVDSCHLGSIVVNNAGAGAHNFIANVPGFVTGIDQTQLPAGFKYYPNPAIEVLFISNDNSNAQITITNQGGQVVYSQQNVTDQLVQIDTHEWSSGVYFVQLLDSKRSTVNKVVISR